MSFHGNCPQCSTIIPPERFVSGLAVCECGWCDTTAKTQRENDVEKKTIIGLICAALSIMAFYAHAANWGSYALSIPFVKIAQVTGTLSTQGYKDLADQCITLNKWSCARDAYLGIFTSNRDVQGLSALGHFEVRMGNQPGAIGAYMAYFKNGGKDGEAALDFAKVLESSNQYDQAIQYYEASILARPLVLPIQATAGIVRLQMKQGKYEEAYQRILAFHESAENAKGFLNTELAQLESTLHKTAGGKTPKKHV